MLSAYYGYTVLFLNFFPKSQIILWGGIAIITPFCGFLIWQIHRGHHYANFSTAKDKLLLGIVYLCFTFSFLTVINLNKKRLFSLLYGILESIILILLIRAGIIVNPYDMLNI